MKPSSTTGCDPLTGDDWRTVVHHGRSQSASETGGSAGLDTGKPELQVGPTP
jgi:hypothetical protein